MRSDPPEVLDLARERMLEQIGSTAQAAVDHGLTAEEIHREIDIALDGYGDDPKGNG